MIISGFDLVSAESRVADHLSDFLFAPTETARRYLEGEGIPGKKIHVTGNTVVDAVFQNLEIAKKRHRTSPGLEDMEIATEKQRVSPGLGDLEKGERKQRVPSRLEELERGEKKECVSLGLEELEREVRNSVSPPGRKNSREK